MSKSSLLARQPEAASGNGQSAPFPTAASIRAAAGKASVKSVPSAKSGAAKAAPRATGAKAAPVKPDAGSKPDLAGAAPGAAKARAKPAARSQAAPAPTAATAAAAADVTVADVTVADAKVADATAAVPKVAKPVTKVAVKPAVDKAAARPRRTAVEPGEAAAREKAHKPRLVRDSFTMPEGEYALLNQVKRACLKAGFDIKKSELLRIGVAAVSQLDMATLQQVLSELPQLKTGRPKKT